MSVSSPCEVCGAADVRHTCDRCGRLVCADHYDDSLGFCVECAAEVGGGGGDRIPTGEDMPDGVDVYRS
ncbi:MAG: hypothetical protein V5A43_04530 [Haloarculaceae archaeon]